MKYGKYIIFPIIKYKITIIVSFVENNKTIKVLVHFCH
jgi:hypothetical protein